MKLNLANGWTLSVVRDIFVPFFTAAAWPTADPEVAPADTRRWFAFEHGGSERRFLDVDDLIEIAEFVAKAERPT
jgi:hypothetical protein